MKSKRLRNGESEMDGWHREASKQSSSQVYEQRTRERRLERCMEKQKEAFRQMNTRTNCSGSKSVTPLMAVYHSSTNIALERQPSASQRYLARVSFPPDIKAEAVIKLLKVYTSSGAKRKRRQDGDLPARFKRSQTSQKCLLLFYLFVCCFFFPRSEKLFTPSTLLTPPTHPCYLQTRQYKPGMRRAWGFYLFIFFTSSSNKQVFANNRMCIFDQLGKNAVDRGRQRNLCLDGLHGKGKRVEGSG